MDWKDRADPWSCNHVNSGRYCKRTASHFYIRPCLSPEVTGRCAAHERGPDDVQYFDYVVVTREEIEVRRIMES